MSKDKVTRWRVGDGPARYREGAWEVCISAGEGRLDIVTFSGPNAAGRSARYAEEHGWKPGVDFAAIEAEIDEEMSIEDMLS